MFNFEWPLLFVLLPAPLLVYRFMPRAKREHAALRVPFYQRVQSMLESGSQQASSSFLKLVGLSLIWVLLISAAARPTWLGDPINLPTSGRDLLVAVDISGSMETADMLIRGEQFSRLNVVKHVVGEFVKRRLNDRLGLILFGTNAYLQSPLTFDKETVNQLLQEAQLGFAGEKTAIGDAIGLAVKRLKDRPDSQRVLILLTDGANTAGEIAPRKAAELAEQAGVKIYTIGVGADSMRVRGGLFGSFDRQINPSADLDEPTLEYISEITGGQYFRARNPEELDLIYRKLDEVEPIEQDDDTYRPSASLFYWPLSAALFISFMLALLNVMPNVFSRNALVNSEQKTQEVNG